MRWLFQGGLLAVVACLAIRPTCALAQAAEVEAIATRQTAFSVRFLVDPNSPNPAVEMQLHVSADRGGRWDLYDKVKPDRGSFVFRAPHDGEYWFAIRSLDQQGNFAPPGSFAPALKVIVDTLAPRVDVSAERLSAGELSAQWQIVDPSLKVDSLKIEYRTDDKAEWQELAASQARITEGRSTLTGDGVWWPQDAKGPITLRISAADRAGNPAVTQVVVKPIGSQPSPPNAPEGGLSIGNPNAPLDQHLAEHDRLNSPPRRETPAFPVSNPAEKDTNVENNPFDRYRDRTPAADPPASEPPPRENLPPNRPWPNQGSTNRPLETAGDSSWRLANTPGGSRGVGAVHGSDRSSATGVGGTRGLEVNSRNPLGQTSQNTFSLDKLSPAERPKMVNRRTFNIDYDVELVGSSGVAKVELFGTRDGGESWISLGTDPDNRSPLVVTVNGEGVYGFVVVVESASGLTSAPPRPGQQPDHWIGVDLTKPQATLTGAEPGNNPDELVIYWEVRDARLESRPVSLYFSDRTGGKWIPIAAALENTGSYVWRMDNRVREQIYLKLEARDEAGNIVSVESPEPISLNRQLPKARIRGVRPVGPEADNGQARRSMTIENEYAR
jgi:hypothetical protein